MGCALGCGRRSPENVDDIPFVDAESLLWSIGEHVDNAADSDPLDVLKRKAASFINWDHLSALYLDQNGEQVWGNFEGVSLQRAMVKYDNAIQHAVSMFKHLSELTDAFDFEVSVDETDSPTTPLEHFFIANELTRLGVKFTSLAPRFIGRFEKGVDYIGD
jgi:hypothetical protein